MINKIFRKSSFFIVVAFSLSLLFRKSSDAFLTVPASSYDLSYQHCCHIFFTLFLCIAHHHVVILKNIVRPCHYDYYLTYLVDSILSALKHNGDPG